MSVAHKTNSLTCTPAKVASDTVTGGSAFADAVMSVSCSAAMVS